MNEWNMIEVINYLNSDPGDHVWLELLGQNGCCFRCRRTGNLSVTFTIFFDDPTQSRTSLTDDPSSLRFMTVVLTPSIETALGQVLFTARTVSVINPKRIWYFRSISMINYEYSLINNAYYIDFMPVILLLVIADRLGPIDWLLVLSNKQSFKKYYSNLFTRKPKNFDHFLP